MLASAGSVATAARTFPASDRLKSSGQKSSRRRWRSGMAVRASWVGVGCPGRPGAHAAWTSNRARSRLLIMRAWIHVSAPSGGRVGEFTNSTRVFSVTVRSSASVAARSPPPPAPPPPPIPGPMTRAAIDRVAPADERAVGAPDPGRSMARCAFHLVLGQVVMTALALVLSAALGRGLGPSHFRVLYLITTIVGFSVCVVDWGQTMYMVREVAPDAGKAGALLGTALVLRVLGTVLVAAVVAGGMALLDYDAATRRYALVAMAATLPFVLASPSSILFRRRQRMDYSAGVDVANRVLVVAVTLPTLWLGGRLLSLIAVPGIAGIGALVLAALLYRRLRMPPARASLGVARALLVGGAPLVSMSLAIAFRPYIDAILLSKLAPPDVVGWYGAARNFMSVLVAPAPILGTAPYPP